MSEPAVTAEVVARHLRLFPPEAWLVLGIEQGKVGVGAPPVHHRAWWERGNTAKSLLGALERDRG